MKKYDQRRRKEWIFDSSTDTFTPLPDEDGVFAINCTEGTGCNAADE
jgi:hypothetical protein